MSVNTKEFEIVVFGATSFVGKILCNYLCNQYREPNLRWAMAARSSAKLAELKAELVRMRRRFRLLWLILRMQNPSLSSAIGPNW